MADGARYALDRRREIRLEDAAQAGARALNVVSAAAGDVGAAVNVLRSGVGVPGGALQRNLLDQRVTGGGRPVSEYAIATWILRGVDPQRVRARGGFSLLDLKRFAETLGYRAEGYGGMTLADVADLGVPAIVPVRIHGLDHFVVVRAVLGGRVVIGDPAFGNLTVDAARFEQLWKGGIAFVVLADGAPEPAADRLAPDVANLRVPDLPSVGRLLRGAGPAPLTRGQPAVP